MLSMLNIITVVKLLSLSLHLECSNETAIKDDIKSTPCGRGLPVFCLLESHIILSENIH